MKKSIEFESNNHKIQGKFYHAEREPPFPTVLLLNKQGHIPFSWTIIIFTFKLDKWGKCAR